MEGVDLGGIGEEGEGAWVAQGFYVEGGLRRGAGEVVVVAITPGRAGSFQFKIGHAVIEGGAYLDTAGG